MNNAVFGSEQHPEVGLVERVETLEDTLTSAYKVMGSVTQADANDWKTNDTYATMENGWVWDVNAEAADDITIEIPKTAGGYESLVVNNGENIVWIKNAEGAVSEYTYGYFDKMSSSVVDSRVEILQNSVRDLNVTVYGPNGNDGLVKDVTELKKNTATVAIRPITGETWSSTTETGAYIVTGLNTSNILVSAIIYLLSGKVTNNNVIQLGTTSYTDIFSVDASGVVTSNPLANNFNITRIGG